MDHLFPFDNIIVGVLVLIVGFVFHWLGQLISVINWDFASKKGLQEAEMPKEYKVYEHATAVADSLIGWIYGIAGVGLLLNASWGYKLAWFPGVVFVYHSLNFWFYTKNRNNEGNKLETNALRYGWTITNLITGILAIALAWRAG